MIKRDFHYVFELSFVSPYFSETRGCDCIGGSSFQNLFTGGFRFYIVLFEGHFISNSNPTKFIDKIIKNRQIKHNNRVIWVSQSSELNIPKSFISFPYVPILREILKQILHKHNTDACFQSGRPLGSFLNSGKDLIRGDLVSGVHKIPCYCGKFYW